MCVFKIFNGCFVDSEYWNNRCDTYNTTTRCQRLHSLNNLSHLLIFRPALWHDCLFIWVQTFEMIPKRCTCGSEYEPINKMRDSGAFVGGRGNDEMSNRPKGMEGRRWRGFRGSAGWARVTTSEGQSGWWRLAARTGRVAEGMGLSGGRPDMGSHRIAT